MRFENYDMQIGLRIGVLFAAMLGLAFAVAYDREYSLMLLLGSVIVIAAISLVRYTRKLVRDLTTYFAGFRFGDFQQVLSISHLGTTFHKLESDLDATAKRFQKIQSQNAQQAAYFKSLLHHMPLPFLILREDGGVDIMNKATRRAFNVAEIVDSDDLARFGVSFQRDVLQIQPGESLLSTLTIDNSNEHYILTATSIGIAGQKQKLVALLNIQGELDATELATWQNLLRVTSHEILNSLAPVSSCAQTAESLISDVLKSKATDKTLRDELEDIRNAVDTMARRSEGLMRFVKSYRQLTRMPPPKTRRILISDYFKRVESLLKYELAAKNIAVRYDREPANLTLLADQDMLDQAIINLVRNAADAVEIADAGAIDIRAYIDSRQRVVLEVADNGPGIDEEVARNIFVPFFTTKAEGSGVGLALVRYIMLTHGGSAIYAPGRHGGSIFRLVF